MQSQPVFLVIMAGGIGSRFYPLSRENFPKQFHDVLGRGKTMLQESYERLSPLTDGTFVVTHQHYTEIVRAQLPDLQEENILAEPFACNTAPCIAYSAFKIAQRYPDAGIIVTPADHVIEDEENFRKIMLNAQGFTHKNNRIVTLGILPMRPDTGYGYIKKAENNRFGDFFKVEKFTEKPDRLLAEKMFASGNYFWNAGIFVWNVQTILDAYRLHLPEMYELFSAQKSCFYTEKEAEAVRNIYAQCQKISVDFGIMEKAENVYVLPADIRWSDVGTWKSLFEISEKNEDGNVVNAEALLYETKNCIIKSDKKHLIIAQGLENYIIVEHDNVILICQKDQEQRIKQFLADAKDRFGQDFD